MRSNESVHGKKVPDVTRRARSGAPAFLLSRYQNDAGDLAKIH